MLLNRITKIILPLLRDQPSAGSEMKPLTLDGGYNNVLLGQGCHTPLGDDMSMEQRWNDDKQKKTQTETCFSAT
jgi:hypothetical protein